MSKDVTPKTEPVETTNETALTLSEKYLTDPTPTRINITDLLNGIGEEQARQLATLYKKVTPSTFDAADSADWQPPQIRINNGKGSAPESSRMGDFYIPDTGEVLTQPITMFPIFSHHQITKWGKDEEQGQLLVQSIDGKKYKNFETGEYFDSEDKSKLPVKPGKYVGAKQSGYEFAYKIYFVDKGFTNLYTLVTKTYGIKECYDVLTNASKGLINYDPTAAKTWFELTTINQVTNYGNSKVPKAKKTTTVITPEETRMIMFFKQIARDYYTDLLRRRDEDEARIKVQSEELKRNFETQGDTAGRTTKPTFSDL